MKQEIPTHTLLFVKTGCPYSAKAREFLAANHVDFIERNVTNDREATTELKRLSNQEKTPALVYEGEVLTDFDAEQLSGFLAKHGVELERAAGR